MSEDHQEPRPALNELSHEVIGAAILVHRELGPGLLDGHTENASNES